MNSLEKKWILSPKIIFDAEKKSGKSMAKKRN